MKSYLAIPSRSLFAALALGAAACSGNFATGTGMPQQGGNIPPVNAASNAPYNEKGLPQNGSPSPGASVSPGVANAGTYPLSQAQDGFACPATIDGYSCLLKFNLPPPTPTPAPAAKGKKAAAKPSPSPTPTATPAPSPTPTPQGSGSPAPTPKPTPTPPTIALQTEALPKDAPTMVHTPANSLQVVPLMMVHLTPTADFKLDGYAQAQFTLPKEQVAERGFAVQLFHASIDKHKKTTYTPLWTFDKSTLNETTLTFAFDPPKTTISKGSTYVLVLYGDDKTKSSPAPAGSGEPSAVPGTSAPGTPAPGTPAPTAAPGAR